MAHHLNVIRSAHQYDPVAAGLAPDLTLRQGPSLPVLRRLDPLLRDADAAVARRVRGPRRVPARGLARPAATPANLRSLIPPAVPSGMPVLDFEF